jgi:HAD superfamily hydrolase (TIGR01509 family)
VIAAVVFDMDGVIISSEEVWDEVREGLAREVGAAWPAEAQHAMMGMNTAEWTGYMRDAVGIPWSAQEIGREVERRLTDRYRDALPLIPGAVEAVRGLAAVLPLGLASSSTRGLIDAVLDAAGLAGCFTVTVSSEEVARGKPAPDVYLRALEELGVAPSAAAAIEDSAAGLRAAAAAGMRVVAIPNPHYPPADDALALADIVLGTIAELRPETLAA